MKTFLYCSLNKLRISFIMIVIWMRMVLALDKKCVTMFWLGALYIVKVTDWSSMSVSLLPIDENMPFNMFLIVLLLNKSTAPHFFMSKQASLRHSFFSAPLSSPAGLVTSFSGCCASSTLSMLHFTSRGCITYASFLSFSLVLSIHSSTLVDIKRSDRAFGIAEKVFYKIISKSQSVAPARLNYISSGIC